MSEAKHSPPPWKWFNYPDGRKLLTCGSHAVIHCPDGAITISEADAALIAAAPDLLEALTWLLAEANEVSFGVDADGNNFVDRAVIDKARAAVAKATGGKS